MKYSTKEIKELAVAACKSGEKLTDVARMYSINRTTLYRWNKKAEQGQSLERKKGSGRPPKLSREKVKELTSLILKPASEYGYETDFWTLDRIRQIAKKKLNVSICKTAMYNLLYNEKYSYKKPEKRFYEASEEDQKNWLENDVEGIKKCVKDNDAILYFEDEASISLESVIGKTWGPVGKTSIHKSTGNRASISAMSAISNSGKLIFTLHQNKISSLEVVHFLSQMIKNHPNRHLVVVMDRAPPHTSKITREFINSQEKLHVFYLPARSPEFNPDEKVWNHLKNHELKSHSAKNKKELTHLTRRKLFSMSKKPSLLRGIFMRCEIALLLDI